MQALGDSAASTINVEGEWYHLTSQATERRNLFINE